MADKLHYVVDSSTAKVVQETQQEVTSVEKTRFQQEIKALESSLGNLPDIDEYVDIKARLEAKISEKKKSIFRAKPLGAQIDSSRDCSTPTAECTASN